jgi:nucleoside-diphosphate-sugar epimerase
VGSKGNIFIALHIIGAMIASGVARAVFIKTVSAVGIFAELDEESESEEEIAENKKD